ncbi:MAG: tRNA lysidine(34) synthetase TilS [Rhodanobacteraceae bacterium]
MSATARKPQGADAPSLTETLRTRIREEAPPTLCVAYSGGPDSTALLHALAELPEARGRGLRALHVDHGLHPESANWAKHCTDFCAALGVPLTTVTVHVDDSEREGVEAAARRARYAAIAEHLEDREWLALAQHRDDQTETVLLKLLRGAGPEGLGGMRALRPFARGFLWRPLLETSRGELSNYLIKNDIHSLNDPANADRRFSRNILRHEILPAIVRHWPHAEASILHSARLCRAAGEHLARDAEDALTLLRRGDASLDADAWQALPEALRAPVLDLWLRERGLTAPTDAQRHELERQTAEAAEDAVPCIAWRGAEIRIWDGRLHAAPPLTPLPTNWQSEWNGTPLGLPEGCGTLTVETTNDASAKDVAIFNPPLAVRLRRGGERIKPAGEPHTRELRDLFQKARVPPWLRMRCPLIYADDELIAVADLWINDRGKTFFDACDARPRWTLPKQNRGQSRLSG